MTTTTTQDWKTLVQQADRDWAKDSVSPVTYRFSGGNRSGRNSNGVGERIFRTTERPGVAYPWKT